MNTSECIMTRRSVRVFEDRPVEHIKLERLVGMAAYAPSWKNTQITRYIAVENKAVILEIGKTYAPSNAHILNGCPLLMAVTAIRKRSGYERDGSYSTDRDNGWQMFDCGVAVQTFCLAAHEEGLGTVIMGVFDRPALERYLNVPEERELVALVAVGYPAAVPAAPKRKSVEELLGYME